MTFIGRDGRLKSCARRYHHRCAIRLLHGTNRLHRRRGIRRCAVRCSAARCNAAMERCSVVLAARYIVGQPGRCNAAQERCSRATPERYNEVQ